MLHIGILAHSADGAALCFLEMIREAARRLGAHEHPEITLSILPMGPALEHYERNDLEAVRAHLTRTAERLVSGRLRFLRMPGQHGAHRPRASRHHTAAARTAHRRHRRRARQSGWPNASRFAGNESGRWKVPVYPAAFARCGIDMRTPPAADRELVDDVIFTELAGAMVTEASREQYIRIIEALQRDGCDAVALSCTEIPLLVTPDVSPLPTLDSTRLLAQEAVAAAIQGRAPTWRGGPR